MSIPSTIEAAHEQLAFWKQESGAAHAANDPDRIARCEKFIAQCEAIIAALTANAPRPAYIAPASAIQRNRQ